MSRERIFGALVVVVLAWHMATKIGPLTPDGPTQLWDVVWICHLATLVIAAGLLGERPALVATGLLVHVAVGLPAFAIDLVVLRKTTLTSLLTHAIPPVAAFVTVRAHGYPGASLRRAVPLVAMAMTLALATPPSLNINVVHAPWPPLLPFITSPAAMLLYRIGNLALACAFLVVADRALRRLIVAHVPATEAR